MPLHPSPRRIAWNRVRYFPIRPIRRRSPPYGSQTYRFVAVLPARPSHSGNRNLSRSFHQNRAPTASAVRHCSRGSRAPRRQSHRRIRRRPGAVHPTWNTTRMRPPRTQSGRPGLPFGRGPDSVLRPEHILRARPDPQLAKKTGPWVRPVLPTREGWPTVPEIQRAV